MSFIICELSSLASRFDISLRDCSMSVGAPSVKCHCATTTMQRETKTHVHIFLFPWECHCLPGISSLRRRHIRRNSISNNSVPLPLSPPPPSWPLRPHRWIELRRSNLSVCGIIRWQLAIHVICECTVFYLPSNSAFGRENFESFCGKIYMV